MPVVDEWIEKAEADYRSAVALNRKRKEPVHDVVCYHCQQCSEKYLKAYIADKGSNPPRIHDLEDLLSEYASYDATLLRYRNQAIILDPYGILIRYPGMTATILDAAQAVKALRILRRALRKRLGLL